MIPPLLTPFSECYVRILKSSSMLLKPTQWPTVLCQKRKHRKILVLCNLIPPLQVETPQTVPLGKGIKKRQSTVYIWDDFISFIQRVNVDWDKTFILQELYIFSAFFVPLPFYAVSWPEKNKSFLSGFWASLALNLNSYSGMKSSPCCLFYPTPPRQM